MLTLPRGRRRYVSLSYSYIRCFADLPTSSSSAYAKYWQHSSYTLCGGISPLLFPPLVLILLCGAFLAYIPLPVPSVLGQMGQDRFKSGAAYPAPSPP